MWSEIGQLKTKENYFCCKTDTGLQNISPNYFRDEDDENIYLFYG